MGHNGEDLYERICELRGQALDTFAVMMRSDLALSSDEVGRLVVSMQQVSNQLGAAQALLAGNAVAGRITRTRSLEPQLSL